MNSRPDMTLRDRLRAETHADHERVDAAFGSCDFADSDGYRRFLTAQAAAWKTLEPMLDGGSLDRAAALAADLDALGIVPPPALDEANLPPAGSLGMRYVLEGSRLGSTVLLRELEARSPTMAATASRYLVESARLDGWRALSGRLQSPRRDDDGEATIVNDARRVFALFERAWRETAAVE